MASAWITILTETWAGVTVIWGTGFFVLASRITTVGVVVVEAWRLSRSTCTTASIPANWLFGPSTLTVGGVMVVALTCSW